MPRIQPLVLWRDPEAVLAWLNCRYGFIRGQWDFRYPDTHAYFNRAVLADPRTAPEYHMLRAAGLGNAEFVSCLVGIVVAGLAHFEPALVPVWRVLLHVMFAAMLLVFWRLALGGLVLSKLRTPMWLMASSWCQWGVFLTLYSVCVLAVFK